MNLDKPIADALENQLELFNPPDAADEAIRLEAVYRKALTKYSQRIADTKRDAEASLALVEQQLHEEFERHSAAVGALQSKMDIIRQDMGVAIAADEKLLAASQAALETLTR